MKGGNKKMYRIFKYIVIAFAIVIVSTVISTLCVGVVESNNSSYSDNAQLSAPTITNL